MLRKIFVHEIRQLVTDRTFLVLTALLITALGFGLWNGERWVAYQNEVISAAQQEQADAIARAKAEADRIRAGAEEVSWWRSAADTRGFIYTHLLSYAAKPPASLGSLAVGQSDLYPYLLKVTPEEPSSTVDTYENVNVRKLLLGPFDLAFAIIYLLPLFILALSYDVLAGEKEQGILNLLAAQPVSLPRIVFSKVWFRLVLVVAIIALLLGSILLLTGFRVGTPAVMEQLPVWFGIVIAYSLFWFLLGVLVISRGWRSATNALVLAGMWILFVVLFPIAVNAWVTSAYPLPSRIEFIRTLRDTKQDVRKDRDQITEQFFVDHPELRPQAADDKKAAGAPAMRREIDRRLRAEEEAFREQLQRQQDLAERLKFLSPALLVHSAFLDLAGTGLAGHREFLSQVESYHGELEAYFTPKLVKQEYDFAGYDEFPRFKYQPPGPEGLQAALVSLVVLTALALALALASLPGLRRYPIVETRGG